MRDVAIPWPTETASERLGIASSPRRLLAMTVYALAQRRRLAMTTYASLQ